MILTFIDMGASAKDYRVSTPERLEYAKLYYRKNRNKRIQYAAQWSKDHPDKTKVYKKRWKLKNPDKVLFNTRKRRAKKRKAPGMSTQEQIRARIAFYGGRCAYCHGPYEALDHVIPLSLGGSNWPANLRPSCKFCNSSKGVKHLSEWRAA